MADGHPSAVTDFRNKIGTKWTCQLIRVVSAFGGVVEAAF